MAHSIPDQMKAIVLKDYDGTVQSMALADVPLPTLRPGQVLVKIAAAPINPSDLVFLTGNYGIIKPLPVIPGFEGSGTVVATGGGWFGRYLMGKNVAFHAPEDGHGTWAEYIVMAADHCLPLLKNISLEQGANLTVNPMTACALTDLARSRGHQAFVQTAAASAVGQMIARLALNLRMTAIHVVRRLEQVKLLKDLGCDYVFDTNDPLFMDRLAEASYKFKAKIAFDAVGGDLTRNLTTAMPPGSCVVVYGALSGAECRIRPQDLIFNNECVEGFWLTEWIKTKRFLARWTFGNRVQRLLPAALQTQIQGRFPLHQFTEAISLYKKNRSSGKVLLIPHPGN